MQPYTGHVYAINQFWRTFVQTIVFQVNTFLYLLFYDHFLRIYFSSNFDVSDLKSDQNGLWVVR